MPIAIDKYFNAAVTKKASDLHFIAGLPAYLRIDGTLKPISGEAPLSGDKIKDLIYGILSDKQKVNIEKNRELDMSYSLDGSRFRVNVSWGLENMSMAARVISNDIPTLPSLGMPKIVYDLLKLKQGLILVTGPTGCGKSTSLAGMIDLINHERNEHIITLEDPIEFVYKPAKSIIHQRQLGSDMLTFPEGLKHILRQDPNVILVGEMRDLETIASTITLAETGHLVLATLHTLNAAQTVDRIIDVFPPYQQPQVRLQLSLFLKGIISQFLMPKKTEGGRVAAREVLINTPAISNLIRENKVAQIRAVIQTSAEDGMFTMDQDIRRMYDEGIVSEEVATAHMVSPENLLR
ncbi:MAG: type IV pilus twitching motility protein PilT [Patescibacteria group bacterium]